MTMSIISSTEVILAAYNKWIKIKKTTRHDPDAFYDRHLPLRRFAARDALHSVWNDTQDEAMWQSADWDELEAALIAFIDDRLAPDSSYRQEMARR